MPGHRMPPLGVDLELGGLYVAEFPQVPTNSRTTANARLRSSWHVELSTREKLLTFREQLKVDERSKHRASPYPLAHH
eukprot:5401160-Pleurochrysis_carterae.AAC.1